MALSSNLASFLTLRLRPALFPLQFGQAFRSPAQLSFLFPISSLIQQSWNIRLSTFQSPKACWDIRYHIIIVHLFPFSNTVYCSNMVSTNDPKREILKRIKCLKRITEINIKKYCPKLQIRRRLQDVWYNTTLFPLGHRICQKDLRGKTIVMIGATSDIVWICGIVPVPSKHSPLSIR